MPRIRIPQHQSFAPNWNIPWSLNYHVHVNVAEPNILLKIWRGKIKKLEIYYWNWFAVEVKRSSWVNKIVFLQLCPWHGNSQKKLLTYLSLTYKLLSAKLVWFQNSLKLLYIKIHSNSFNVALHMTFTFQTAMSSFDPLRIKWDKTWQLSW